MVHSAVQAVVLAWADAPNFEEANTILKEALLDLSKDQIQVLRDEVAEINIETFLQVLLSRQTGDDDEVIQVDGVSLNPQQLKRVSAWVNDQAHLAAALGLDRETWASQIDMKMKSVFVKFREDNVLDSADIAKAEKLLGEVSKPTFQARLDEGKGFASLLAARTFKKEPR